MTLRVGHELMLAISLLSAMITFVCQAHLPLWTWPLWSTPFLSCWLKLSGHRLSETFGTVVAVLGLLVAAGWLMLAGSDELVRAMGSGLMLIITGRLLTRDASMHDLQLILLGLVLMAASAVLADGPFFMLGVVVFLTAGFGALMTREWIAGFEMQAHRSHDRRPLRQSLGRKDLVSVRFILCTLLLSFAVQLCAIGVFVVFPRGPQALPSWMVTQGWSLPRQVSLQTEQGAILSPHPVARITGLEQTDFYEGLYLRGAVYDALRADGFALDERFDWQNTPAIPLADWGPTRSYDVALEPSGSDLLLTLGPQDTKDITALAGFAGPHAYLSVQGEMRGRELQGTQQRYHVRGRLALPQARGQTRPARFQALPPRIFAHYTTLPEASDPRIAQLALRLVAGARDDADKVRRLRDYLGSTARYSRRNIHASATHPLSAFLFVRSEGHCEYFALALATLLRAVGLPSRVIGGYQGGEWDAGARRVLFSAEHAHVWVEWFDADAGWVTEDASPAVLPRQLRGWGKWHERLRRLWDDHLTSFGFTEQLFVARHLSDGLTWATWALPHTLLREQGQHTAFSKVRLVCISLAVSGMVIASLFAQRWWRRRHGLNRLRALVWRRLAQRSHRRLVPNDSLQTALAAMVPATSLENNLLRQAVVLYQACRFGRRAVDHDVWVMIRALRQLPNHPGREK